MSNILVDPVIIITPPEDATKEIIEIWIENLAIWLSEVFSSPHNWLHIAEMLYAYVGYDRLPNFDMLTRWQKKFAKDGLEIDIADIMQHVTDFLNQEEFEVGKRFEDHLLELGYVAEIKKDAIRIYPQQFVDRWPDSIRDEISLLLASVCAGKCKKEPFACDLSIATLMLSERKREVEISTTVTFLSDAEGQIDQDISEILPLLFTPEDIEPLDIVSLWNLGERGVLKAVEQKYKQDWQWTTSHHLSYRIGPRFMESITSRQDITELLLNRIVRTMAAVIADRPDTLKHRPHEVREREEVGTPQLVRVSDGAKAWRTTITPDGAGWRMHYWKGYHPELGDFIEFSNVLTKHDTATIY